MPKYKVLKPVAIGGRKEVGEVVEVSEDVASAFGSDYLLKIEDNPAPEPAPVTTGEKVEGEAVVKPKRRGRSKK
ncbi:MAG: hypothetical protein QXK26_04110 [Candidatus Bathyarchaeia archaeon]